MQRLGMKICLRTQKQKRKCKCSRDEMFWQVEKRICKRERSGIRIWGHSFFRKLKHKPFPLASLAHSIHEHVNGPRQARQSPLPISLPPHPHLNIKETMRQAQTPKHFFSFTSTSLTNVKSLPILGGLSNLNPRPFPLVALWQALFESFKAPS